MDRSSDTDVLAGSYRSISVTRRNGQELINCQEAREEEVKFEVEKGIDRERYGEGGEGSQSKDVTGSCSSVGPRKSYDEPEIVGETNGMSAVICAVKGHNLERGSEIYQSKMAPDGKATNNHFILYHDLATNNNNNEETLTQFTLPRSDHGQDELVGGKSLLCTNQFNSSELNSRHEFVVGSMCGRRRVEEEGGSSTLKREDSKSAASQSSGVAKFETPIPAFSPPTQSCPDLAQEKPLSSSSSSSSSSPSRSPSPSPSSHFLPLVSSNSILCSCRLANENKLEKPRKRGGQVCCCPTLALSVAALKSESNRNEQVGGEVGGESDKSMRLKSVSQVVVGVGGGGVDQERPDLGNNSKQPGSLLSLLLVPCCDVTERGRGREKEKGNESQERENKGCLGGAPEYLQCEEPFESERDLLVNADLRCSEGENYDRTSGGEEGSLSRGTVVMGEISTPIEAAHNGSVQIKATTTTAEIAAAAAAAAMKQEVDKVRSQSNISQQESKLSELSFEAEKLERERSSEQIEGEDSDNLFRESCEPKPKLELMQVVSQQQSQGKAICERTSLGTEDQTGSTSTVSANITLASPLYSTTRPILDDDNDNDNKHRLSAESRPVEDTSPVQTSLIKLNNNKELVGTQNMELEGEEERQALRMALQVCETVPATTYSSPLQLGYPNSSTSSSSSSEIDQRHCTTNISDRTDVASIQQQQQSDKQDCCQARQSGRKEEGNSDRVALCNEFLEQETDSFTENTTVKDSPKAWKDCNESEFKSCELETRERARMEARSEDKQSIEIESARERLLKSASFERSSLIDCTKGMNLESNLHSGLGDSENLTCLKEDFSKIQQFQSISGLVSNAENFRPDSGLKDAASGDNLKNGTQSECRSLVRDSKVEFEAIKGCDLSRFKSDSKPKPKPESGSRSRSRSKIESTSEYESESESKLSQIKADFCNHKHRAELLDRVSQLQESSDCEDKPNTVTNSGASQLSIDDSRAIESLATAYSNCSDCGGDGGSKAGVEVESIEDLVALSQLPKQSICFEASSDETSIEIEASRMCELADGKCGDGRKEGRLVSSLVLGESNDACDIKLTPALSKQIPAGSCGREPEKEEAVARGKCLDLAKAGGKSMSQLHCSPAPAPAPASQIKVAGSDKGSGGSEHTNKPELRRAELGADGIKVCKSECSVEDDDDYRDDDDHHCRMARSDKVDSIENSLSPHEPEPSEKQVTSSATATATAITKVKVTAASSQPALLVTSKISSQKVDTQTRPSSSGEDALGKDEPSGILTCFNEKQRVGTENGRRENNKSNRNESGSGSANKGNVGEGDRDDAQSSLLPDAIVIFSNNNNDGDELVRRGLEEKSNKNETCTFSNSALRSSASSSSTSSFAAWLPQSQAARPVDLFDEPGTQYVSREYAHRGSRDGGKFGPLLLVDTCFQMPSLLLASKDGVGGGDLSRTARETASN